MTRLSGKWRRWSCKSADVYGRVMEHVRVKNNGCPAGQVIVNADDA